MELVACDRRDKLSTVQDKLRLWSDRNYVESRIVDIDRKLLGRRAPAITGAPGSRLFECKRCLRICGALGEFVKEIAKLKPGEDWFANRITALRSGIQSELKVVQEEVQSMLRDTSKRVLLRQFVYCEQWSSFAKI